MITKSNFYEIRNIQAFGYEMSRNRYETSRQGTKRPATVPWSRVLSVVEDHLCSLSVKHVCTTSALVETEHSNVTAVLNYVRVRKRQTRWIYVNNMLCDGVDKSIDNTL